MREHFVNGRPWSEALAELRVFVKASKEKIPGQSYHGIDEYMQLFDNVLGNDHYNVEFSEQNYIQIRSEQDIISVK